jgi:hypothetical protein
MPADVGSIVHPWYKGIHEWEVKKVAKLNKPIEYHDDEQGNVQYDPKIMLLDSRKGEVLWFNYWMSTDKAKGKMRYGGGPPMLEENVLFKLIKNAIDKDMFSKQLLRKIEVEIKAKLA